MDDKLVVTLTDFALAVIEFRNLTPAAHKTIYSDHFFTV